LVTDIPFEREPTPDYDRATEMAPGVRRLTARNPGPFTFHGTNTYLLGTGRLAIIDPGPDDPEHVDALLAASAGAEISHIILTHTHLDHSGATGRLAAATGAQTVGAGPHRPARPLHIGEVNPLDASADLRFFPDRTIADGATVAGDCWTIEAIATPGHTANHLAYALRGSGLIFSGDHVMGWATTIVAPPDGAMADYMRSLDRLLARPEEHYLPGHGGPIAAAHAYVRGLKSHRRMRETAIVTRLGQGDRTIADLVAAIYRDTPTALHGAARLSVLAHLEDLVARGLVVTEGPPRIDGSYRLP
jgi:glyoxylase-like metal-dependent hydrolase (beta-lactamase superfamily II)